MSDGETRSSGLASLVAELKSDLDQILAAPRPDTNAGRVALLESHLKNTLEKRAAVSADVTFDAPDIDEAMSLAKSVAKDLFQASRPVALDISPCGTAVVEGVALITAGSVLGPHGALLGFAAGVYLLTQHCGEGDTFFT
jgi:hypothetical protein